MLSMVSKSTLRGAPEASPPGAAAPAVAPSLPALLGALLAFGPVAALPLAGAPEALLGARETAGAEAAPLLVPTSCSLREQPKVVPASESAAAMAALQSFMGPE
jgi:hypothetical protein